jgi:hypothetical protein
VREFSHAITVQPVPASQKGFDSCDFIHAASSSPACFLQYRLLAQMLSKSMLTPRLRNAHRKTEHNQQNEANVRKILQ